MLPLRIGTVLLTIALASCAGGPVRSGGGGGDTTPTPTTGEARDDVERVLDDWHAAAAAADFGRYFGAFAADGVFIGTDPGERWTVNEFRDYARPHFERGRAWTCHPYDRHVALSPDVEVAWVDELLDHTSYGVLRGTAVLRRDGTAWRIVHYCMTFAIPNDVADAVVEACKGG